MARPVPQAAKALGGAPEQLWRLRVTYAEQGRLAMLSHLEVARFLERVVRRAGLPHAVTHGFSPHMRIAFGSALPVGVGSTCEIFDVFLTRRVDEAQALAGLQAATVPDMPMLACAYVGLKDPAASVALPQGTYRARLDREPGPLAVPDEVRVVRKGKEKALSVGAYLVDGPHVDGCAVQFTLRAKPEGSLRADDFLHVLLEQAPEARVLEMMRIAQHE